MRVAHRCFALLTPPDFDFQPVADSEVVVITAGDMAPGSSETP